VTNSGSVGSGFGITSAASFVAFGGVVDIRLALVYADDATTVVKLKGAAYFLPAKDRSSA
jgi:hypothetical protein